MSQIKRSEWSEFQKVGLLWWVNRALHLFGWAIVLEVETDGTVTTAYPARVTFRGFDLDAEDKGFAALTKHLDDSMPDLIRDIQS